ncbi:MAG TPA: hypothetical protein VGK58_23260, partial [Lacipirellulaceae bacterium]
MTTSNENQDPITVDEQHDRLIDIALREVVGNETPPDLSAKILAANLSPAAASVGAASRAAQPEPRTRKRAFWAALTVAAMLLVSLTLVTRPPTENARTVVANNRAIPSEFSSVRSNQSDAKDASTNSSTLSDYFFSPDVA